MNKLSEYDWAADYRRNAKQLREQAEELLHQAEASETRAKEIEAEERGDESK